MRLLVLIPCVLFVACGGGSKSDAPAKAAPAKEAPAKVAAAKAEPEPEPPKPVVLEEPADPDEACAQVIVVAHADLEDAPEGTSRDAAAAKKRAAELLASVTAPGADFRATAEKESDHKSKERRGAIGTYTREGWPEKHGDIAELVFGLKVNEIGGPVEAPYGFTLARRCKVEKVHTRHILVRFAGAKKAPEDLKRTREEAKALAQSLREQIDGGKDFAEVAKEHSEDGSSEDGGDLGSIGRGLFVPPYEEAAFALKPGEVTPPVETVFGFHLIKREE